MVDVAILFCNIIKSTLLLFVFISTIWATLLLGCHCACYSTFRFNTGYVDIEPSLMKPIRPETVYRLRNSIFPKCIMFFVTLARVYYITPHYYIIINYNPLNARYIKNTLLTILSRVYEVSQLHCVGEKNPLGLHSRDASTTNH